jgi:hypothetical protein
MKTGRTLQELAIELHRQAKSKRDFVVHSKSFIVGALPGRISINRYDANGRFVEMQSFETTNLFHRQLGDALGIPSRYYDKMMDELPELLSENVYQWLQKGTKRYMLRTLDGQARALLSDRYRRIDHLQIAQAVLPVIGQMPDARVESCEVTPNKLYLKVVNPRLQAEVRKGDIVQAGIVISNSEVGLGSVAVMPLVYRLVCSNGMIVNALGQRKYPIGRENEESWELFSSATIRADDRAFMMKLRDVVRTAVDEARFAQVVDKLRESAGVKLYGDVPTVVELAAKEYGFSQTEQSGVLRHLIEGHDLTLYGLSNAVTRASQEVESYDRATAMETAGWQMITMAPQLWRALNGVR